MWRSVGNISLRKTANLSKIHDMDFISRKSNKKFSIFSNLRNTEIKNFHVQKN